MSVRDILKSMGGKSSRRPPPPPQQDSRPTESDLALQTLKKKYREFLESDDREERDCKLLQLVPLFNKCCGKLEPSKLEEKFEEVFDFAENVAFLFVRHVTQLAQSNPATLFEYFEGSDVSPAAGKNLLKGMFVLLCKEKDNVLLLTMIDVACAACFANRGIHMYEL